MVASVVETGEKGKDSGSDPSVAMAGVLAGGARAKGVDGTFDTGVASVEASWDPTKGERSDSPELGDDCDRDAERLGRSWYRPDVRGVFPVGRGFRSVPLIVSRDGCSDDDECGDGMAYFMLCGRSVTMGEVLVKSGFECLSVHLARVPGLAFAAEGRSDVEDQHACRLR